MKKIAICILMLALTASTTSVIAQTRTVVAKTANYAIQTSDSGTIFTNEGAAGFIALQLPAPSAGLEYEFVIVAPKTLRVTVNNGATQMFIYDQEGYTSNSVAMQFNGVGATLRIVAVNNTTWAVMGSVQDFTWDESN